MATKEEDNFLRVVYLNYRVGTTALRRYFDSVHPNLQSDLSSPPNKAVLSSLHKPPRGQRRVFYQEQWDTLYPSSGLHVVSSTDLDVTLMVCLLRNLPPQVSQPPTGFDDLPQPSDLSPGAHIARIKCHKNFIVSHSKDGILSDNDFNTIWIDLERAIKGLGNQQDVTDAAEAKSKCLDYEELKERVNRDDSIQRNHMRLTDHGYKLADHTTRIAKLEVTVESVDKDLKEFKDGLINATILDKEVLDSLISNCVLTLDDKEEICSFEDQSSRNNKLLEILMQRPYNTFDMFVEVMKESDQKCYTSLVVNMKAKLTDKDSSTMKEQHNENIAEAEKQTVKLIKWYKTLVNEIDFDKNGMVEKLSARGVISMEDCTTLKSEKNTQKEKNREILENIIRKNISSASTIFLEILKEDSCYSEYATRIGETDVTQRDLELLYIGKKVREREKKKNRRKKRKRNGMTDLMIDKTEKWERDDSLYINTRATEHVLTCIKKHKCVSVIGPSGIGKTALVRNVALKMEINGYTIFPIADAKELKDNYKSDRKTLYIVDDLCGNFTANLSRIEEWNKSIEDIKSILENSKYKLILTCRLQVFQDKGFRSIVVKEESGCVEIFKTCVCNLGTQNLSLTSDEKEKLSVAYFKEHSSNAIKHLGEYEFFPLLCKLYHLEKTNPHFTLEMSLNDPFSFYKQDLIHMYNDSKEGKYTYCALLLLVLHNNKLEEKHLTGEYKIKEIIEDLTDVFDIDENITVRELKTQLKILIGTFVTYDEDIYKTIHDKLFDFLAFYFGTQEQVLNILIKYANGRFIRERFVVTDENESVHYSILLSNDKLQLYTKRVFDDIVCSCNVHNDIRENENFDNIKFRTMLFDFMDHLSQQEISALIERANSSFLNTMFVMRTKDVKDNKRDRFEEFKCYEFILTDDMLQHYIEKWFKCLIETNSTGRFMKNNSLLTCATFCNALKFFIKQLSPERIAICIQTGSKDFLNTMFVMTKGSIKVYSKNRYECFGIIIPDDLLHQYINRVFDDLTKSSDCLVDINKNRTFWNVGYRTAFHTYMRQLTTEKIATLIQTASDDFINQMFYMAEEIVQEDGKYRCKSFGIVIPDDLLQQYIQRLFDNLTKSKKGGLKIQAEMSENRPLMNGTFCTAFRTYILQLTTERIASLIQTSDSYFIDHMFVMSEDNSNEDPTDSLRIVIPDYLLPQYIQRLFYNWTEEEGYTIEMNMPLRNVKFRNAFRTYIRQLTSEQIASLIHTAKDSLIIRMFVMTDDDIKENSKYQDERFGIVIPGHLVQQYTERLFDAFTKIGSLKYMTETNRPWMCLTFCTSFRVYLQKLTPEKIASLIQTADIDFIIKMFIMEEEDMNENADNAYEFLGIVIPNDMLPLYLERLINEWSISLYLDIFIDENRPLMNVTFQRALRTHFKQLSIAKIASLIQTATDDFLSTMFVMTEEDINKNVENRYECFGIVIPYALLQQYIQRLFNYFTNIRWLKEIIDENRPLKNVTFRTAFNIYLRQLTTENIASLIQTAHWEDFINLMFIIAEDDIKDDSQNRYEYIGIVIPDVLLQQYCKRLIGILAETSWFEVYVNENRPLMNDTFRTAFRSYIRQLTTDKIASFIQTANEDFFNKFFVMADEDIKENVENRYECLCIVIPDDLIQQYIWRWFYNLSKPIRLEKTIDENRPLTNVLFRTALLNYTRQFTTNKIASIIQTADVNFINKMFVMTEEDVKINSKNRYECFGIVIPNDLIQQYIWRWLDCLPQYSASKKIIDNNRPVKNVTFRTALRAYRKQLNAEKVFSIIQGRRRQLLFKILLMYDDDMKYRRKSKLNCLII